MGNELILALAKVDFNILCVIGHQAVQSTIINPEKIEVNKKKLTAQTVVQHNLKWENPKIYGRYYEAETPARNVAVKWTGLVKK